jgi:hypothetical protein
MAKVVKVAFDKSSLKRKLKRSVCLVSFNKLSTGKPRNMRCTLKEEEIPSKLMPKGTGTREPNGIIRVFDTQKQGWRSFHVDSINSFDVMETATPVAARKAARKPTPARKVSGRK